MINNMMDIKTRLENSDIVTMREVIACCDDIDAIDLAVKNKMTYARIVEETMAIAEGLQGVFVITDDAGDGIIIATEEGKAWYYRKGVIGDEVAYDSTKDNGYKYPKMRVDFGLNYADADGVLHNKEADLHGLIMMLRDRYTFKQLLIETGFKTRICANHMNGCPLDNRYDNLEWCTVQQNSAHGNVLRAIRYHYPQLVVPVVRESDGKVFNKLLFTLSYKYIEEYDYVHGGEWHCGKGQPRSDWEPDKMKVLDFLGYLWEAGYIDDEIYRLVFCN